MTQSVGFAPAKRLPAAGLGTVQQKRLDRICVEQLRCPVGGSWKGFPHAHVGELIRGLVAVKLQHVDAASRQPRLEQRVVGIDEEADAPDAFRHARAERLQGLEIDVLRRSGKRDEPDPARARGACKLTLEVLSGNHHANQLYARVGFACYQLDPAMGHAQFLQKWLD